MGRRGVGAWARGLTQTGVVAGCCLALASCGKAPGKVDPKYGVSASPRVVQLGERAPKGGGTYRVGNPYTIAGRTYVPQEATDYSAEGIASWYGEDFHGRLTANGEIYDMESISAAHPTLPIPSYVRVTNLANRRSVIVRVNDRGPFHRDRVIDLSARAAQMLGFQDKGVARVRVEYVARASLAGSDDRKLAATLSHDGPAPSPSQVRVASATPTLQQRSSVREPVPTPAGRPFELGQDDARPRLAVRTPASQTEIGAVARRTAVDAREAGSVSRPPPRMANAAAPSTFHARFEPLANAPAVSAPASSLSAYAPAASARGAVMTGRGLY